MDPPRLDVSFVEPDLAESFNAANLWRVETILRLGLTGESRWIAANPGLAFPQFFDFLTRAIGSAPAGPVVDLGAGLGGVSEAVRRSCGRTVIACDEDVKCGAGTLQLFPDVTAAAAVPSSLPLREGSVAACYSCGVFSLLDDPRQMLVEAARVLTPGGRLVLIDVTSASSEGVTLGAGSYPPAERLLEVVEECGFAVSEHAAGHTRLSDWALADHEIAREIARTYRGETGFDRWLDDRRRLERLMRSEQVLMFGLTAHPA